MQASVASLLLRHMNWNKERLIEKYMDNASAVSEAAGITLPEPPAPAPSAPIRSSTSSSSASRSLTTGIRRATRRTTAESTATTTAKSKRGTPSPAAEPEPFVCPICFDDTQTETLSLECGHQFCTDCWNAYTTNKVRDESELSTQCMAEGCSLVAPDAFISAVLASDQPTLARFHELDIRHFVASNPNLKYCPAPSCTFTVSCPAAASKSSLATVVPTVACEMQHKFCFGCAIDGDHRPVICSVAKMWLKKCHDDSETANWIKSNTKECSKCQSTIEKNGGCKYVLYPYHLYMHMC